MSSRRFSYLDDHRTYERRRARARDGRITASMWVGRNGQHLLEIATTTHPLPMPLTEQNIVELEAAIAEFRARAERLDAGPEVTFPRVERLVV